MDVHSSPMDDRISDYFSVSSNTELIARKYFHTSIVWKIVCVKDRSPNYGGKISSPVFKCADTSWKLTLYPRGTSQHHLSETKLHIQRMHNGEDRSLIVYIKFMIFSDKGNSLCIFTSKDYIGFSKSEYKYFELSNFGIVNELLWSQDPLIISFSIYVEEYTVPVFGLKETASLFEDGRKKFLRLSQTSNSLSSDFEDLYKDPQFSDITLKLGEEEFQAHKLVLRSRSKVFAAMFEHDMKENQQDTVDLVQMEVETVRDMLRYIYCGKVDELSPEQALNLYVAADRYDLKELKAICREFISYDISINNVSDIALVADLHNDESLIDVVKFFLFKNGREIIKTEKWRALSKSNSVLCTKMFEWAFSE